MTAGYSIVVRSARGAAGGAIQVQLKIVHELLALPAE